MSPLTFLTVAAAILAVVHGDDADFKVFNLDGDDSVASVETSNFAWAPLGLDKVFVPAFNEQIRGGKTAKNNQFPYQVSMQVLLPCNPKPQHICGGALIGENWVLTSARCVTSMPKSATNLTAVLGINSLSQNNGQRLKVRQYITPSEYNSSNSVSAYDIALIKLDGKAQLNSNVQLAYLPLGDAVPKGKATFSGWGATSEDGAHQVYPDKLQTLDFPIIDLVTCKRHISKVFPKETNPLKNTMICAGDLTKTGHSTCNGDSGSPLTQKSSIYSQYSIVIGVSSWTLRDCGSTPFPSIFTRVSHYYDWIQRAQKKYA